MVTCLFLFGSDSLLLDEIPTIKRKMEKLAKITKALTFKAFSCIIKVSIKDRKVDIMATIDRFTIKQTLYARAIRIFLRNWKATIEPALSNNATEIPTRQRRMN